MRKPDYQRDGITLYCGDCLDVLPELSGVDCVVTDPPYGIAGTWKGGFSNKHGWGKAKGEATLRNSWDETPITAEHVDAMLGIGKQHIIWGGNHFPLPPSRCWFVWNKPERNFTLAECELAWTDFDNVARVFDCHRSDPGRFHPTQKPLDLMTWCVEKTSGRVVCDPFMGSGTTGVACIQTGRNFIGIEKDPTYFATAVKRIDAALDIDRDSLWSARELAEQQRELF